MDTKCDSCSDSRSQLCESCLPIEYENPIVRTAISDIYNIGQISSEYAVILSEDENLNNLNSNATIFVKREKEKYIVEWFQNHGYSRSEMLSTRGSTVLFKYIPEAQKLLQLTVVSEKITVHGIPLEDANTIFDSRTLLNGVWVYTLPTDTDYLNDYKSKTTRTSVWLSAIQKNPCRILQITWVIFLYYTVLPSARTVNRRWNPFKSQPTIVILGPDDSGKTTTVNNVEQVFESTEYKVQTHSLGVYNESTIFMSILKRVRNWLTDYNQKEVDTAKERGRMELSSRNGRVKTLIHMVDVIGRILHAQSSGSDIIISDRHIHDMYIYDSIGCFEKRIIQYFSKPPLHLYVLDAETNTIANRSEFTEKSIERMRESLENVDGILLDVSDSPNETLDSLFTTLITETTDWEYDD